MAASFPRLSGICRMLGAGAAESQVHFVTSQSASSLPALQLADLRTRKITATYEGEKRTVHVLIGDEARLSEVRSHVLGRVGVFHKTDLCVLGAERVLNQCFRRLCCCGCNVFLKSHSPLRPICARARTARWIFCGSAR